MEQKYAAIAFSDAVRQMQEAAGSRASYARMEKRSYVDGLTENERAFIGAQDSFYLSTVGSNGYPYIQHRGGPQGFVRVIDDKKIGFVDFSGNKQFISVGNIRNNDRAALIVVDYPARARLKIYARSEILPLDGNEELYGQLVPSGYEFRPERMIVFHIEAYDWNCPQHITRRFPLEQLQNFFNTQADHIRQLEEEIRSLKKNNKQNKH